MTTPEDTGRIIDAIEGLRQEVARLEARIAALEAPPTPAAATRPEPEEAIEPETMMAIAAALAAFFGKKPRIRSIRLLRSNIWGQEGRATIQAWYSVSPKSRK